MDSIHDHHNVLSTAQPPPPPPPPPLETTIENKISPSILLIVVILAVFFFISGLLHLLVRYLLRPTPREPDDSDINVTALQGQLQQLFHLHDSGVDQAYIDTLPVFLYRAIIGLKDPFDCAVCLCEFEPDDRLRLLPKCSHAFHLDCIDTWLLSHSTCPLCRGSLLPDFSPALNCSPAVLVLESGSEREVGVDDPTPNMGFPQEDDSGPPIAANMQKEDVDASETTVVQVKLGKFRNGEASSSTGDSSLDQRRCFSMGYNYEYVMSEASVLQVAIRPSKKKPSRFKKPGNYAMSECDCHSRREGFKGFDSARIGGVGSKRESFSVSKIWMRSSKDKPATGDGGSRRALSFRLPQPWKAAASEFEMSEMDMDVEVGSCNGSAVSMGSQLEDKAPSFARRTLLWIAGRQNRVGSHA